MTLDVELLAAIHEAAPHAVVYVLPTVPPGHYLAEPDGDLWNIEIRKRGHDSYSIHRNGSSFVWDGTTWEMHPTNSDTPDEFRARTRFTLRQALDLVPVLNVEMLAWLENRYPPKGTPS